MALKTPRTRASKHPLFFHFQITAKEFANGERKLKLASDTTSSLLINPALKDMHRKQ